MCVCVCVCVCVFDFFFSSVLCVFANACVYVLLHKLCVQVYTCVSMCTCVWLYHSITQSTMQSESHPVSS